MADVKELIKKNEVFKKMTKEEKKKHLCNKIKNAINLDIHSNVCYLLNFCDMPQEMATKLSEYYNAIYEIITEFSE